MDTLFERKRKFVLGCLVFSKMVCIMDATHSNPSPVRLHSRPLNFFQVDILGFTEKKWTFLRSAPCFAPYATPKKNARTSNA